MNGFDVCKSVKGDPATARIKVVLFSNRDSGSLRQEGQEAGADGILSKTAKSQELTDLIERLLGEEQ